MADTPLSDEEREDLIAYLDGELDEAASRSVEAKLNRDPQVREEAEALRQAWDLLDYLPRPEPSATFTHRTLNRISSLRTMGPEVKPRTAWRRAAWAVAVLLAVALGYVAARQVPRQYYADDPAELEQQLVRDLRLIDNLRLYQNVEDLKFLKELDRPDLFGEEADSVSARVPAQPVAGDPEKNRQLLDKWMQEPEHHVRLERNLAAFRALSPEQQDRLRQLDGALYREDPATRGRLVTILQRYSAWLEHLSKADLRQVETATSDRERLRIVERLRERQWLEQLPKADRAQVQAAADPKKQAALIEQLRREQRQLHDEWVIARRFWNELMANKPLPSRLQEFPPEVQAFVRETLNVLLNEEEKRRLNDAQGQWPLYPRTLVELADLHPLTIPGPIGPLRWKDVPKTEEKLLRQAPKLFRERLVQVEGRWPDFAIVLVELHELQPKKFPMMIPQSLRPSRPAEFPAPLTQFITAQLLPRLKPDERARLADAEGKWPLYPQTVMDLARKHALPVPGTTLPGPPGTWDKYRLRAPAAAIASPQPRPGRRPVVLAEE